MKLTIEYPCIKRLGELTRLAYNDISPMNEIAPDTEALINGLPAGISAEIDEILTEQGLADGVPGELKPTKPMNAFLKALFAPEKCLRAELKEESGSSDVYFIPFDGAWVMMNAKHGELTVAGPVSYEIARRYLTAAMNSALENGVLSAQYRDGKCRRSLTVTNAEEGYAFFGSLFDKTRRKERVYIHSFPKTEKSKKHIAEMLTGESDFYSHQGKKIILSLLAKPVMALASAIITAFFANTLFSTNNTANQIFAALFFCCLITAVRNLISEVKSPAAKGGVGKRLKNTVCNMLRLKPPTLWFFIAAAVISLFLPYAFALALGILLFTSAVSGKNSLLLKIKNAVTKGKNPERNGRGLAAFSGGLIACGLIVCILAGFSVPTLYGVIDGNHLKSNTSQTVQVDDDNVAESDTPSEPDDLPGNRASEPNDGDVIISGDTPVQDAAKQLTDRLIEYAGSDRKAFEKLFRNTESSVIDQYYNTSYDRFQEYGNSLIAIAAQDSPAKTVWFTALYYQIPEDYPAEKEKSVYLSTIMTVADDGWKIEWNDNVRSRLQPDFDNAGFSPYGLDARDMGHAWAKFFIPFDLNTAMIFYDNAVMCKIVEMYMDENDSLNLTFYASNGTEQDIGLTGVDITVADGDLQLFSKSFAFDLLVQKGNVSLFVLKIPPEELGFTSWSRPTITDFRFRYNDLND